MQHGIHRKPFAVLKAQLQDVYRKLWCWQDEWYGLDREAVRRIEADTAKHLERVMHLKQEPQQESESEPKQIQTSEKSFQFDREVFESTELIADDEQQGNKREQDDSCEEFVDALETERWL